MKDLADELREDPTLVIRADEEPVILNPKEEAPTMQECEYCGHYPCGCGG